MPIISPCANPLCNKTVSRRPSRLKRQKRVFCSYECKGIVDAERNIQHLTHTGKSPAILIHYTCQWCKQPFTRPKSSSTSGKFCSKACHAESMKKPKSLATCLNCHKEFTLRNNGPSSMKSYCSMKCFHLSITGKSRTLNHDQVTLAIEMYNSQRSLLQIAKDLDCDPVTVKRVLKSSGITLRKKRVVDPKFLGENFHTYKPKIKRTCKGCRKEFLIYPYQKETAIYCSRKCRETKVSVNCPVCEKVVMLHPYRVKAFKGCSKQCRDTKKPMICTICGTIVLLPPNRWAAFKVCSRKCRWRMKRQAWPHGETDIEKMMSEVLTTVRLKPDREFQISKYFADFAFPKQKLIIECDGAYWHDRAGAPEHDQKRDHFLRSQGWYIVRFPEHEIRSHPLECAKHVKKLLRELRQQVTHKLF